VTLGEVLAATTDYFARKGIDTPRLDAELILSRALGLSRIELYTSFDRPLTTAERGGARELVERRGRREPLAYVLGDWAFRGLTLRTDPRALVPRPETEVVVERALAAIAGLERPLVVDVGTGTGAIALAIADEHPGAEVTATDVSRDALTLAEENAAGLELEVSFFETSLLVGLAGPFDLVVSNPPYVTGDEIEGLEPEVRDWEPRIALVADGDPTLELARQARAVLQPGGAIVLESHEGRARAVADALTQVGYVDSTISLDLAGKERVVEARWEPGT
jgi:release factor glutamine methyltransferase